MNSGSMDDKVLARGEEIFRLIPQRPPMTMVDTLFSADDNGGESTNGKNIVQWMYQTILRSIPC